MDRAEALFLAEVERNNYIDETIARGDSPVQQFYAGAVLLITGGSGFLGKQLLEKLFRSCNIQKVYILLRQKNENSLQERVQYILQDELYRYLHENSPEFVDKLIPVAGDITKNRLGLSKANWDILTEEVDVIFHVAATVNFLEGLKMATLTNVRGTREMLTLAKACKKLKSFVHVSTAYAHATRERVTQPVREQFYPSPAPPALLIQLAEQLPDDVINHITPHLLSKWPNTYAFTKAVAEEVVRSMAEDLPVCIVRPAIVMQAYKEPPGWADTSSMHNSIIGFIVGICMGGLHVMYSRPETYLDIVPVDLVNNAVIAAAHATAAKRRARTDNLDIYTVSRYRTPYSLKATIDCLQSKKLRDLVTPRMLWYPYVIMTEMKFIFFLLTWLLHYIPGYLADGILVMAGKKRKVIKLFDKAYKQSKVYGFYLTNDWKFDDSNLVKMCQGLAPADRIIYNCDTGTLVPEHYIINSTLGARKYIFRDGLQNTEYACKKMFWLQVLNIVYLLGYAYVLWKITCVAYGIYLFCVPFIIYALKLLVS